MRRLLVLRPEPGASETVRRAEAKGLEVVSRPLFAVEAMAWEAPEAGSFDGLLLTSANALRHGGDKLQELRGLPAFAVGEATAQAARDAGFDIKSVGGAGVDRLLGSIEPELKLLHLCGEDRRPAERARQEIVALPVYRAVECDVSVGDLRDVVALVHSPRAGRRLAELVEVRNRIAIVAISEAAAEGVGEGWASVEAANEPTDEAVLALAARLCNTTPAK
jgi:uroporphyrinogen-III synthase